MNDTEIKTRIRDMVNDLSRTAEQRLCRPFPPPEVEFFENQTAAGFARWRGPGRAHEVAFNLTIAREHFEEFCEETVPHEVAHIAHRAAIDARIFPPPRGKRFPTHGRQWQTIMRRWFGVEPRRTHSWAVPTARRQRSWPAICGCQTWQLSTVRRNRMLRGKTHYRCPQCKNRIALLK